MKVNYVRIMKLFVGIFIAAFLLVQLYNVIYNPFSTEMVSYFQTYDSIRATAWFVRSEQVLTCTETGVKNYLVGDGERVAKNGTIANLYSSEDQVQTVNQIAALDSEIASLQELESYSATSADLSLLNSQIKSAWISLLSSTENAAFSQISGHADTLLSLLNRKSLATGETASFAPLIQSLQASRDALAAAGSVPTGSVITQTAGYFVSTVDGYETVFSPNDLDALTPTSLLHPEAGAVPDGAVGKIVEDYQWYLAVNVPFSQSLLLREGSSYTIRTGLSTMASVPTTLLQINSDDNDDYVTAVFLCKYNNGELSSIRTQNVDIVLQEYAGLRVNAKAVRVVDGVKGVYVQTTSVAKFKEIEILYNAGDYLICAYDSSDSEHLNLYDEVIVKGRNLYDGKTIDA